MPKLSSGGDQHALKLSLIYCHNVNQALVVQGPDDLLDKGPSPTEQQIWSPQNT